MAFRREPPPFILAALILSIVWISVTVTEPLFGCLIFLFTTVAAIIPFMAFIHPGYFHSTKQQAWKNFANSSGLNFDAGNFFRKAAMTGTYRGYDVRIDTYLKPEIPLLLSVLIKGPAKLDYSPYTRLNLSVENLPNTSVLSKQKNVKDMLERLKPKTTLRGQIIAKPRQSGISYEQKGIEIDEYYLQLVLQTLSELADVYIILLALGGEIVPILLQMLPDSETLHPIAVQLLYDIEQKTNELNHQTSNLLCPNCLARYATHTVHLRHPNITINYCGCRICNQSRVYLKVWVIVVLDKDMLLMERSQKDRLLRVNWLIRRTLFDFDEVQIINTTDEEVERFAVQVGNDTDPSRVPGYKQMQCNLVSTCQLSENTLRILKRIFGKVEVR